MVRIHVYVRNGINTYPDHTPTGRSSIVLRRGPWTTTTSKLSRPPPNAATKSSSYKLFTALKYGHPQAKLLYSEYCTFAAQQRYTDNDRVKKQMYKVHFVAQCWWEAGLLEIFA
jgi:hypothetical protein